MNRILFPAGLALLLAVSCEDVDEYYKDILPADFQRQIVSFKEYGQQEIPFDISNEVAYNLTILKGGIRTLYPTDVQIEVLSQEELDEKYNDLQGSEYKVMPSNLFIVEEPELTIPAKASGASTFVTIRPKKLFQMSSKDKYVLPLRLVCATDSVNVEKKELIIIPKVTPAEISFDKTLGLIKIDQEAQDQTEEIMVRKNAMLAVPCEVKVLSQKYVTETYGKADGVDYKVIPAEMYEFIASRKTLAMNDELTPFSIKIHSRDLIEDSNKPENASKVYVLPLQLSTSSTTASVKESEALFTLVTSAHVYSSEEFTVGEKQYNWKVVYTTFNETGWICPIERLWDGIEQQDTPWFSHQNDDWNTGEPFGKPFLVLDITDPTYLASFGYYTSGDKQFGRATKAVKFSITDFTGDIDTGLTEEDWNIINNATKNQEHSGYYDVLAKLKEIDSKIEWKDAGTATMPDRIPFDPGARYDVNANPAIMNAEIKTRYVRLEFTPFPRFWPGTFDATGCVDRCAIQEIYLKKVTAIDGVPYEQ